MALIWRDSTTHQVEGQRTWSPNVVSLELATGGLRYFVIGAYCPPSDLEGFDNTSGVPSRTSRAAIRFWNYPPFVGGFL